MLSSWNSNGSQVQFLGRLCSITSTDSATGILLFSRTRKWSHLPNHFIFSLIPLEPSDRLAMIANIMYLSLHYSMKSPPSFNKDEGKRVGDKGIMCLCLLFKQYVDWFQFSSNQFTRVRVLNPMISSAS